MCGILTENKGDVTMNNKTNKTETIKGDVTMNNTTVQTNKTANDVVTRAVNSALEVGTNSTVTFRNAVTTLKKCDYSAERAVQTLFNANSMRADKLKIERAKLYTGLRNCPDILKELGYKTVDDFVSAHELGDTKSTVSEMIKVYSIFYDTNNKRLLSFMSETNPSFTELTELCKTFKGAKTTEERVKELCNFLDTYAPNNIVSWCTCKELRDKAYIYVHGVEPTPKTGKTDKSDKTDNAEKGNVDYKSVKSVADTSMKDANATIKALKDSGDFVENKGKGTTTITAKSVDEFMTALTALARKQGVKPLSFTGELTFVISGHK